ncbi:MAG: BatA and WFA domain-containing protein [Candidatus Marinimicrobia bacterium]|jgi:hypothetical protein|nr:BatA and WFA domain-containing protein [Candidatus Neomarinimicrobiota bacterium]MDP6789364.1 BatA and WFA domain-containing protein [Candidatus Neomarinimicrobiota bacterium]
MTFLAPSLLWGLALASVPLIIHLLSMRNTKDVEFSSLRYIKELEHDTIRRMRLKQWLLVLLRMLAVASLILMLAQPVKRGFLPAWMAGEVESHVIVLVDNSASMSLNTDDGTLLDRAKSYVPIILNSLETGSFVEIHQTNPASKILEGRVQDLRNAEKAVQNIGQSHGNDALWQTLASIIQRSESKGVNKECFILSDFQDQPDQSFEIEKVSTDLGPGGGYWRFYCLAQRENGENLGVGKAEVVSQIKLPNQLLKMNTNIRNSGTVEQRNVPVELYLDDTRLGQVVASFPVKRSKEFQFQVYPGKSGLIKGRLEIPRDDFLLDNVQTFELSIPSRITCTLLCSSKENVFLLESVLRAIDGGSGYLDIDVYVDPNPERLFLDNTDILLVHDAGRFASAAIQDIQSFLEKGGALIWFAGAANALPDQASLFSVLKLPAVKSPERLDGEAFFSVLATDQMNRLIDGLGIKELGRELPQVFGYYRTDLSTYHKPLLKFSNGDTFLIEYEHMGNPVFVFTSPMNLDWNDLAVRGLSIPLLHRMIVFLATDESNIAAVNVGEPKVIRLTRENIANQWEVVTPSGESIKVVPDYNSESLIIANTLETGSYDVLADGELHTAFSVLLSPGEDPFIRATASAVINSIGAERARWIDLGTDLASTIKDIRFGKSLWRNFLLLTLIALMLEMVIARTGSEAFKKTGD